MQVHRKSTRSDQPGSVGCRRRDRRTRPTAGESQGYFRHAGSLGDEGDICEGAGCDRDIGWRCADGRPRRGKQHGALLLVDALRGCADPRVQAQGAASAGRAHRCGGVIDQELIDALVAFIDHSQTIAEDQGATEIITFATSAIRSASNGEAIIDEIRRRTGIVIDVLTGEEEARLTFLAVRRWFGWSSGQLLVMDIGGGSLELAAGPDEEPEVAISLPPLGRRLDA